MKPTLKDDYATWSYKVKMLSTVNYWLTMCYLCFHPLIMVVAYDFWANYHYLLLANSAQQMLLGFFCWALPDTKYEYWIKDKLWLFFVSATLNLMLTVFGMVIAGYFYFFGSAIYSFLSASLLVYLVLAMCPILFVASMSFILIQVKFNGKPQWIEEDDNILQSGRQDH